MKFPSSILTLTNLLVIGLVTFDGVVAQTWRLVQRQHEGHEGHGGGHTAEHTTPANNTVGDEEQSIQPNVTRTYSIGVLLFPGWEPLDVFGPIEILSSLSYPKKMTLSFIAAKTGPVNSVVPPHSMIEGEEPEDFGYLIGASIYATHTFANAPALDILLVPGGMGNVAYYQKNNTSLEDFVKRRYKQLEYLLSVCTGAQTLALSGVLDGRRATTNKGAWNYTTALNPKVNWVPSARWVVDGNIWTSSGVAAGLDMTYAFVKHLYGSEVVNPILNSIEYSPHTNADWDPFSVVWNVPGAAKNRSLIDCTGPLS